MIHTKNNLLRKVIILFTGLFIPVLLIGSAILYESNKKLKNQTLSALHAMTSTYVAQLDESLNQIYYLNINMLNYSIIQKLTKDPAGLSIYERATYINMLTEQLSNIATTTALIDSSHLYLKESRLMFNSSGYKTGSFDNLSPEEVRHLDQTEKESGFLHYFCSPITQENVLAAFVTSPLSSKDYCRDYGLYFTISIEELKNSLKAMTAYSKDEYFFTTGSGFILTSLHPSEEKKAAALLKDSSLSDEDIYKKVTLRDTTYYAFAYSMPNTNGAFVRLVSGESILKPVSFSYYLLITFFLFVFLACCLYFVSIYRLVHKPLNVLTDSFEQFENGEFGIQITDQNSSDFAYLFQAFNTMSARVSQLIEHNYTQGMLLQKAELKQLQAQINPHFLYNSFFMMQRMLKSGFTEEAAEIADALGSYFRYITKNSMDHVTLLEEYEHAKTYAYIQGLRFQNRIEIELADLPDEFADLPVPKLILQPILENAFNYGLHNKLKGGLLKLLCFVRDNVLTISIEENGEELTDEKLEELQKKLDMARAFPTDFEMSGILNIQRRLIIYSGAVDSLHVSRSALGGMCVTITLTCVEKIKSGGGSHALIDC